MKPFRTPAHTLRKTCLSLVTAASLCLAGVGIGQAAPIGFGAFGGGAVMESFEGLSAGPNITLVGGTGFLEPGVVSPFTFPSGATLTGPIPNPGEKSGVIVGDFTIGGAVFGLIANGVISSAANVPFGSAYMGLDELATDPIEFTLPTDVLRVGAFVTGAPGMLTIDVLDALDVVLETHSIAAVTVGSWGTNFLGIQTPGIRKVRFNGDFLVLDKLTFETAAAAAVPEPSTILLLGSGLAGLVAWRMRKGRA